MTGANDSANPGARPQWRWECGAVVRRRAARLRRAGRRSAAGAGGRCFYDADEQIGLRGKYLAEELPAIYAAQAAAVVVFVSAEYAARDWTRLERRAALDQAVRERRECVLPARVDELPNPQSEGHAETQAQLLRPEVVPRTRLPDDTIL